MRNYKNKVCFVQSEEIFQDDTRRSYLKINRSQLLTSNDAEEVFDFIKDHASKNNVFKFLLHIDSGTLSNLLDYMEEKKQSSSKTRKWLKKCVFVCTYSNASYIRNKVVSLNVNNVYFGLAPITTVLKTIPDGSSSVITGSTTNKPKEIMVVVSDTVSPFFQEVYSYFNDVNTTLAKAKVAELTLATLDTFADNGGYSIILSLDTEAEFNTVGTLVKGSKFKKQVQFIECTQILSQGVQDIRDSVSDVVTSSSGVAIQALLDGLNTTIPYESCAASLTLTWKTWPLYVSGKVVTSPISQTV